MSDVINEAVKVLSEKMSGVDIGGTVKFDIEGEGCVMVDDSGVRAGDDDAREAGRNRNVGCKVRAQARLGTAMLAGGDQAGTRHAGAADE